MEACKTLGVGGGGGGGGAADYVTDICRTANVSNVSAKAPNSNGGGGGGGGGGGSHYNGYHRKGLAVPVSFCATLHSLSDQEKSTDKFQISIAL